jgi:lysozyme
MQTKHKATLSVAAVACCTALIAHWEGIDPVAKHNSFDPAGVVTVCYGYTNLDDPTLKAGERFTREQCEELLSKVIPEYAYPLTRCLTHWNEYSPHRQAALISASYNLGPARICNTQARELFNDGDAAAGCKYMMRYTRAAGRELPGLVNRRYADKTWGEYEWCMRND